MSHDDAATVAADDPRSGGVRTLDVQTPDGRVLRVHDAGEPGDTRVPVVVHHGTPQSGLASPTALLDAERRGLRLIGYDRPGYGGSDRAPGRSVASAVGDVVSIVDDLGLDRFLTWGVSGGGPHAAAVAALLPGRVAAAAVIAGVAPFDAPGLDWVAGMGQDNIDEFGAAAHGAEPLARYLGLAREEMLATTPQTLSAAMISVLPAVDVAALTGPTAEWLHASMLQGLADGFDGWLDDDLAFVSDWQVDLDAIAVPVLVVAGGEDLMVPSSHGDWLAARLPGAEALLDADAGHLSLLGRIGEVHAWLLERWATRA